MSIEDYTEALRQIAAEHPGACMMAFDRGDDYEVGGDFDCHPEWSERDQWVSADCGDTS